jgi:hypothetical protein
MAAGTVDGDFATPVVRLAVAAGCRRGQPGSIAGPVCRRELSDQYSRALLAGDKIAYPTTKTDAHHQTEYNKVACPRFQRKDTLCVPVSVSLLRPLS